MTDDDAAQHAQMARNAECQRLAAAAAETRWAYRRAHHIAELTRILGNQKKAGDYLGIDQPRISRALARARSATLDGLGWDDTDDPADADQFPSLPDRDAESIRSQGITLDGMPASILPAIVDGDLRACTYIDGVECELTWKLGDITPAQANRLALIFSELAERQAAK